MHACPRVIIYVCDEVHVCGSLAFITGLYLLFTPSIYLAEHLISTTMHMRINARARRTRTICDDIYI